MALKKMTDEGTRLLDIIILNQNLNLVESNTQTYVLNYTMSCSFQKKKKKDKIKYWQ